MTHHYPKTALALLAGASVLAGAASAASQRVVAPPPTGAPEQAVAAPGVDAAARSGKKKAAGPAATYKVQKGDTLPEVADKLNTTVEALAKANGLKSPYRLMPGQTLKNPKAAAAKARPEEAPAEAHSGKKGAAHRGGETHEVKAGDTLFSIAKRYGVTVDELKAANGIGRNNAIARGQTLKIPGAGAEPEPAPAPSAKAGRETAPAAEEAVSERGAQGRVVTIETAGKSYRVRKGETIEKVARKMGVDADDLIRANRLKKPYRLKAGQTLRGPAGSAKAYVVARGDTLASVAERFDVGVDALRATNGLRRNARLEPGRKLRLPAGFHDRSMGERPSRPSYTVMSPPPSSGSGLPDRPQPYQPARPPGGGPISGAPTASPPLSDAQVRQMGQGLFQWPLKGRILLSFGDRGVSQRNDGIDIAANAGDPVRAAASGDVVYAGDQVPGFGNLVLIKHADGWVTAYGHLGKVSVRMQQKVEQGDQIGEAGTTGGVSEPQLHFEVRYAPSPQERARPVDPALVLPK